MGNKIKKIIIGALFVSLAVAVLPVQAQTGSKDGYGTGAYSELEAGETYLERFSDWFATAGRSKEEKAVIKSQRRTVRKIKKAQQAIARKKREIVKKKKKMLRELKERGKNQNNK